MKVIVLVAGLVVFPFALLAKLITPVAAETASSFSIDDGRNAISKEYQPYLPEGYEVPAQVPASVEDALLMAAWVYLYNQQAPVSTHDGIVLSGHSLAQLAVDNEIAIAWGSQDICGGSSCARRYVCTTSDCIENYANTDPNVIYITLELKNNSSKSFSYLVKTLAHELYHLTLPFGPVATSLYEEYWAFYIGTQVSGAGWMEFEQYNPLKAICLERWFLVYGLGAYEGMDLYPYGLQAEVDRVSLVCTP